MGACIGSLCPSYLFDSSHKKKKDFVGTEKYERGGRNRIHKQCSDEISGTSTLAGIKFKLWGFLSRKELSLH